MNRNLGSVFHWDSGIQLGGSPLINESVSTRQMETAKQILTRLNSQPGVILADEVGLGKTFVALAVAASVAISTRGRRPVVVMVPPALTHKWPHEWRTFAEYCLPEHTWLRATAHTVSRPAEFLRLFDDDADHRFHIAFVAHGALTRQLVDPYTKLALVQTAFYRTRNYGAARSRFIRWAPDLIPRQGLTSELVADLLDAPLPQWREITLSHRPQLELLDDPVFLGLPEMVRRSSASLSPLRELLADLPARRSPTIDTRLREHRKLFGEELQIIWRDSLSYAPISSPLLVLDEAHHVRHDGQLSGLFTSSEARVDDQALGNGGSLAGKFEHMLFLTATPFQMGHRELARVLSRFEGVKWKSATARRDYQSEINRLAIALDEFQLAAVRVQKLWSDLTAADVESLPEDWWHPGRTLTSEECPNSHVQVLKSAIAQLDVKVKQSESLLRKWVIRHVRDNRDFRRKQLPGDAIRANGSPLTGLEIDATSLLPFLIAARARGVAMSNRADGSPAAAYFSEGLASSFEAYRDTRRNREGFLDQIAATNETVEDTQLSWYLDWVEKSMPVHNPLRISSHPKIQATVNRAMDVWRTGEKVLIFCFYKETGRALRREISAAIERELFESAAKHLDLDPSDRDAITERIERTKVNILNVDSLARQSLESRLKSLVAPHGFTEEETEAFTGAVLRFLRTESFLIQRVFPHGIGSRALEPALAEPDGSGRTMWERLTKFAERLSQLSEAQRARALEALNHIQTGQYQTLDNAEGERNTQMILPNVRLANGDVRATTRDILVSSFNMPFFPEILIASTVLSEGVDLHWECRTVIHHDLDWNPSNLEQRTGRLDRIGSMAETMHSPISIYEPYTTGLQDEKMYKVVTERARWFNIVMGDAVAGDDRQLEREANRIPMPEELQARLTLDLSVVH